MAVVVVLPWVPVTATPAWRLRSSASSSERWMTRRPRVRAAISSGLCSGTSVL